MKDTQLARMLTWLGVFIFVLNLNACSSCNNYLDYCDSMEEDNDEVSDMSLKTGGRVGRLRESERLELARKVSENLNLLLGSGYNKQVRPGDEQTVVNVSVAIRSMGPVDDTTENITFDCYFRQQWVDERLQFNSSDLDELTMNWKLISNLWTPDTYFLNGKDSHLHQISVPNRFIRIKQSGQISYSQRLTIVARCSINLVKYPMDYQHCSLQIGSFSYLSSDLRYAWGDTPLSMGNITLAQHSLVNWTYGSDFTYFKNENHSTIFLKFQFKRTIGFYLLQIYVPLMITVLSSFVSFWLVRTGQGKETPARTGLVGSCTLAVVTIGMQGERKVQGGCVTALDIFILLCFLLVFMALLEFVFINFVEGFIFRLKMKEIEKINTMNRVTSSITAPVKITFKCKRQQEKIDIGCSEEFPSSEEARGKKPKFANYLKIYSFSTTETILSQLGLMKILYTSRVYTNTSEVLNNVDTCSRKLFPAMFLILNIVYWTMFLYIL